MRKFTLIAAALMSFIAVPAMSDEGDLYVPTLHVLADALLLVDMSISHPTTYTYVQVPIAGTSQGVSKIECEMRMDGLNEKIDLLFNRSAFRSCDIPIDKDNGILFVEDIRGSGLGNFVVNLRSSNQPRITCEPKI